MVLVGDLNSRIADYDKFVYDQPNMHEPFVPEPNSISMRDYDSITARRTSDFILDPFGKKLIELCNANKLIILNGRSKSDLTDAYLTCLKRSKDGALQGGSSVDYGIVSCKLCKAITDFRILPDVADGMSLHRPFIMSMALNASLTMPSRSADLNIGKEKYVWNPGKRDLFRERLQNPTALDKRQQINQLSETIGTDTSAISKSVDYMYDIFRLAAGRELHKKVRCAKKTDQPPWWNSDCKRDNAIFLDALDAFSNFKCAYTKANMKCKRNFFRKTVRRAKTIHRRNMTKKLQRCDSRDPRQFWRIFNGPKACEISAAPPPIDFFQHFANILDGGQPLPGADHWKEAVEEYIRAPCEHSAAFDLPFSLRDLEKGALRLKCGKSAGQDMIPNEFLKNSYDILNEQMLSIFNAIHRYSDYPACWALATVVPLFKSGDVSNVSNYRGISLISNFAKLFDTLIDFRMQQWLRNVNLDTEFQFAYKSNRSTADAVFVLSALIERQKRHRGKLYCCFVDFSKAFDRVNRDALYYKLSKAAAPPSLIKLVKSYYSKVQSVVRDLPDRTFQNNIGVQQGHVWSPTLFTIYTSDLLDDLRTGGAGSVNMMGCDIFLLAYADDIALVSEDALGLQKSLDIMSNFCQTWDLTVNIAKTKIMIFRNPGPLNLTDVFFIGGNPLEIVRTFKYLGILLTATGVTSATMEARVSQAEKAKFALLHKLRSFSLHVKTVMYLFDCLVSSSATYGCEIFAHIPCQPVEKVHTSFLRNVLRVKRSTPIVSLLGETGRYPLEIGMHIRLLKYWIKLLKMDVVALPRICYTEMLHSYRQGQTVKWIHCVYNMLCLANERACFNVQLVVRPGRLISRVKTALVDRYKQHWLEEVNTMSSLDSYCLYKTELVLEKYFSAIPNERHLRVYTAFRLHSHSLQIERGRYTQPLTPRNMRLCMFCDKGVVEDEAHFLLACNAYSELRRSFIPNKYITNRPTLALYGKLMRDGDPVVIKGVAKFLYFAFELRNSLIAVG